MPSHSKLARLQQFTTLASIACALAWLGWHWVESPIVAILGFVAISMGYSIVLAAEFVALRFMGGKGGVPRPTWGELIRAWLDETAVAPLVFCWRQPFRWREVPDHLEVRTDEPIRRGVVFIHGFVCNRGFWTPWLEELRRLGHPFVAVNMEPVFGSIDQYVDVIEDAVERVTRVTGRPPVLVCHSMGGLAARAWMRAKSGDPRVHHVITIGSPHHGTWLGQFSRTRNGRQMRLQSDWLRLLGAPAATHKFTCWYSNCDNIVFPAATAMLEGADNRLVLGAAHVELGYHPRVMADSLAIIAGDAPQRPDARRQASAPAGSSSNAFTRS